MCSVTPVVSHSQPLLVAVILNHGVWMSTLAMLFWAKQVAKLVANQSCRKDVLGKLNIIEE
jgi:hypothetical protein